MPNLPMLGLLIGGGLLLGCTEGSPPPASGSAPVAVADVRQAFQARVAAVRAHARARGAGASPAGVQKMPVAVTLPNGGHRIDLRGTALHVRALERQPDGSYQQ